MSQRSGRGRHRRRRRHVPVPTLIGSLALTAAASGALNAPASATAEADVASLTAPSRPGDALTAAETREAEDAFDTVATAQRSLTRTSADSAAQAHDAIVATERQAASLRVARAARAREVQAAEEANRWVAPTSGYRLTASFGSAGSRWSSRHTGSDFAAPSGTPVVAVAAGRVVSAGWDGPYGQKVAIEHADGTITWYAHMSQIVVAGGTVTAGQQIGAVGSTGNSTGPHLHLEVRPGGGEPVNPIAYLREQGVAL